MPLPRDWDDAYSNSAHIPNGADYPPRWARLADDFRRRAEGLGEARLDLRYGPDPRHRLDLFVPAQGPKGLLVFVHGGFWLAFDKSSWSHLAAGPMAAGFAVALPSYRLAPEARIGVIVQDVAAAIDCAAREIGGPIVLAGHSAGGHLVTRQICIASPLPESAATRVVHTVSISGLHDLRPLMRTRMPLGLDLAEARAESPALLEPRENAAVTCYVGAAERPEFLRQSELLANVWTGCGARTAAIVEPGRHHFDVLDGMMDPEHPLTRIIVDMPK